MNAETQMGGNTKLAREENAQKLKPPKPVVQVSSQKSSSTVPVMSSPGAGAVAKGTGAGTCWLAGTSGFSRVNVLAVAHGPARVNGPVEKSAYCCPVYAKGDQTDGTAGAEA